MRLTISSTRRNRAKWPPLAAWVAVCLVTATACTTPRGWVPLEKKSAAIVWSDDAPADSLLAAIDQSKTYYRRVPPATPYTFGDQVYTADELLRSHTLFAELVQSGLGGDAFRVELTRKFNVYESIAEAGDNLFTGYYEPLIPGSTVPTGTLTTPLYARPADLVEIPLDRFDKALPARKLMGRVENGTVVPYPSRREIHGREAMKSVARAIVYVNDVDLFFLQIQGSGRVQMPDGRVLRVGYDGSNGHPYRSLGAELIRRELLQREDVTLHSIKDYLARNPDAVTNLLHTNPSYVFFRELEGPAGPFGNLGVPLTPGRSLAADQRKVPPGALAYVMTDVPMVDQTQALEPLRRFMLVQDIGGAIRGHGRADLFWGTGHDAEWRAGYSKHPGRLLVLVAKKEFLSTPLNTADVK